ncbi:antitoxin YezG family protein [Peribacillus aracenensis]|uniref:antitoxin YezG family protein n=1 Tax=Peribacillus aracenensis TaxID=2976708 RepID=UPI0021A54EEB|nr:antitoxin YezG family protein [Peribacillus sp. BBB004]
MCFNGEVNEREGGVFFFFKPKGEEQHVFSHYIPKLYSVDKRAYNKELHKLFQLTAELQKVFTYNDQVPWFSVTLLVNDTGRLYKLA